MRDLIENRINADVYRQIELQCEFSCSRFVL